MKGVEKRVQEGSLRLPPQMKNTWNLTFTLLPSFKRLPLEKYNRNGGPEGSFKNYETTLRLHGAIGP